MKLNPITCNNKSENKNASNKKKDQDAARIDFAIKAAMDEFLDKPERDRAFLDLVAFFRERTSLLHATAGLCPPGWVAPIFLVNRLRNLAHRQIHWLRPFESWQPCGDGVRLAFRSFAHHLLCHYPTPAFMDSAWDLPSGPEAFRYQSWFIQLERGSSFRSLRLPMDITRKMEHFVRHAPDHYTPTQALRYGEARGLGGTKPFASEIADGRLGQRIDHPQFWRTVIAFLAAHPKLDPNDVNPVVDFIHAHKFASDAIHTGAAMEIRDAPWPDFFIKGRTLKSLKRLVDAWHEELALCNSKELLSWAPSGIPNYRFLEKHATDCVYSYAERCHRGETTIWSLRLRLNGHIKRIVTIEIDPRKKSIIQARAQCNRPPGARSREIIRQWADHAKLQIAIRI